MVKCTQDISQVMMAISQSKIKEQQRAMKIKSNREQKQSQTQSIYFKVRATALLPAFTAVKGFHYPPRNFTRSTEDRSTELHHLHSSTEEVSQQEGTSNQVITKRITNFLQTSLYNFLIERGGNFWLQKCSEKNKLSCK